MYGAINSFKKGCHPRGNLVKDERADLLLQQLILFWVVDGRLKDIQLSHYHLSLMLISFRLLLS